MKMIAEAGVFAESVNPLKLLSHATLRRLYEQTWRRLPTRLDVENFSTEAAMVVCACGDPDRDRKNHWQGNTFETQIVNQKPIATSSQIGRWSHEQLEKVHDSTRAVERAWPIWNAHFDCQRMANIGCLIEISESPIESSRVTPQPE